MRRSLWAIAAALGLLPGGAALAAEPGEDLMERSGCISCHRVAQKLIGPAFKDVATKYRSDGQAAARLFDKVRSGAEGVWGDIPMPPNEIGKVSDADLRVIIAWVLQQ